MITGRLEERPLPAVLQRLYADQFTGELVINARSGMIQIYLRDGYPVFVNAADPADLLGRILLEMGTFDEAAHKRSLSTPPEPGQRYGDVVLRLGLCDEAALKQALRAQVRRKLLRRFSLTEGGFAAVPGEHGRGLQGNESMRVHPRRIIYHGVRSWPIERLRAQLQPLSEQAFRLRPGTNPTTQASEPGQPNPSPSSQSSLSRYGFGRADGHVAELLGHGYFLLQELCEIAAQDNQLTLSVVYALLITGELLVSPPDAVENDRARDRLTELPLPPAHEDPPISAALPVVDLLSLAQPVGLAQPVETAPVVVIPRRSSSERGGRTSEMPTLTLELESQAATQATGPTPHRPPSVSQAAVAPPSGTSPRQQQHRTPTGPAVPVPAPTTAPTAGPRSAPIATITRPSSSPDLPAQSQTGLRAASTSGRQGNRPVSFEEVVLMRAEIENKSKVISDENLFSVLGVSPGADVATVKVAFLEAAKKYHPDRIIALGLIGLKEQAEKVFRRVNEAYSVLTDPERREEYVAELRMKESSGDKGQREKELAVRAVNAELAFSRGMVFFKKRDFAAALREFDESVRLNPNEGEHVGYAAWTRFCAGQLAVPAALKEITKAIKMAPDTGRLFYFAGVLHKQNDAEDKALQSFAKAKDLDPRLEEAESEIRLINLRRRRGNKSSDSSKSKPAEPAKGGRPGDDDGESGKKKGFFDMLRQPIGKK